MNKRFTLALTVGDRGADVAGVEGGGRAGRYAAREMNSTA